MPRLNPVRRVGPMAVALTMWDIWRRLPPQQRRWLMQQARTQGSRAAKQAMESRRNRRRR